MVKNETKTHHLNVQAKFFTIGVRKLGLKDW